MHHLDFEKMIDKFGNKYEAVVRMSMKAKKFSEGEVPENYPPNTKVISIALHEYLLENNLISKESEPTAKPAE